MDLREADLLGGEAAHHWYYRSKAAAVRRLLAQVEFDEVLDIGAGSGFFSRDLLDSTRAARACCVDIGYAADRDEWHRGKPIRYRREVDRFSAELALMMDVLEHVEDDRALLTDYAAMARRGARFLVSVPAFMALWSGHDEFLGHKRRYTLAQVEALARHCGLVVERGCYFFGAVLPLAAAVRWSRRLRRKGQVPQSELQRHHPLANAVLAAMCSLELPLMTRNRLAGLTVMCLARKP